ncbi:DUF3379 family protein [Rheinheimera riviphila]|uniref:DUF3379 family protein n=1 Tax=Rheinheimera riviphila TaxID=1834037 RepID=A0A437QT04_9GAMM|nr:DUF3379 family protein [Rheinheimera riviphila]RVU37632.1 DUF3379 family protein [Rheinheimera riviphila]
MDELEFRRRLLSNPTTNDEAVVQQLAADPDKQRLQHELLILDQQIKASLAVPVPADLADRLLLSQGLLQHKKIRQRRWWLGMAASLVLVAGLVQQRDHLYPWPDDIAGHALAHVYHEAKHLDDNNSLIDLTRVNLLLADLGGELRSWPGTIRYASFCYFQGTRSLHLIFNTPQGPVTVFVLPKNHGLESGSDFYDAQFHGHNMQLAKADLVLVAGKNQSLSGIATTLQQQLQFQI